MPAGQGKAHGLFHRPHLHETFRTLPEAGAEQQLPSCYDMMNSMNTEQTPLEDFVILYRRAFQDFGASALWSSRAVSAPTRDDALAITHSLRVEGTLQARRLAEQIEQACRATV